MKRILLRHLLGLVLTGGMVALSPEALASAFQLWEQDGASLGNYHAGYAALANDASIAFYNPAGIIRINNQQVVIGAVSIMADFQYRGNVTVTQPSFGETPTVEVFRNVTAQGGTFNLVPNLHYVAPITDKIGFGFSIDVPFGLKTDYGRNTPLRYAATLTSISVINYSPALAFFVTDQASLGFGFDVQSVDAEFDSVGTFIATPGTDSDSTNKASGTGYGYHLGGLYQFSPDARVGLSYHSQVVHHLSGTSKLAGPVPMTLNNIPEYISGRATTHFTLPPYTALSGYERLNPRWAIMGTAIYTQWSTFQTLTLNNVAGAMVINPPEGPFLSTDVSVSVPEHYRNTWNFSLGADYEASDKFLIRFGVGYDQSPVRPAYRNVQLPDNNRYVVALGGHYQACKALGFDLGWAHLFISQATVNPPTQVVGAQAVNTNGNVNGGADVFGAQVTWNII